MGVTLTVKDAEALLNTKVRRFSHISADITVLRSEQTYTLPADVADAVYVVGDLANLPGIMTLSREDTADVGGAGTWPNACKSLSSCWTDYSGGAQGEVLGAHDGCRVGPG